MDARNNIFLYTGVMKGLRLLSAARVIGDGFERFCTDSIEECKKGVNTQAYYDLCKLYERRTGINMIDANWMTSTDKDSKAKKERLLSKIAACNTSLINEQLRVLEIETANFFLERGQFSSALDHFRNAKGYCISASQDIEVLVYTALASLSDGEYIEAEHTLRKLKIGSQIEKGHGYFEEFTLLYAITMLTRSRYKEAALALLEVDFVEENDWRHYSILTPRDVALYCSVCALATFKRNEIAEKILENQNFLKFVDLIPPLGEMIKLFSYAKHKKFAELASTIKERISLDHFLSSHVETLIQELEKRSMLQYVSPYSAIDMNRIARDFQMEISKLEVLFVEMIKKGDLRAKIDSQKKILHIDEFSERDAAFEEAKRVAAMQEIVAKYLLLKTKLVDEEITIGQQEIDPYSHHLFSR